MRLVKTNVTYTAFGELAHWNAPLNAVTRSFVPTEKTDTPRLLKQSPTRPRSGSAQPGVSRMLVTREPRLHAVLSSALLWRPRLFLFEHSGYTPLHYEEIPHLQVSQRQNAT
jgi:hypothetical protein